VNAGAGGSSTPPDGARTTEEHCPICGAPLREDQDWCLRCGTAARTRLAPVPRWRPLLAAVIVVTLLSLAGLTAALVKLAGGSGSSGSAKGAAISTPATAVSTPAPILATTTTTVTAAPVVTATPVVTSVVSRPSASGPVGIVTATSAHVGLTTVLTRAVVPRLGSSRTVQTP
jgi:hypothetical protein